MSHLRCAPRLQRRKRHAPQESFLSPIKPPRPPACRVAPFRLRQVSLSLPGNPSRVHPCSSDSLDLITLILTSQHLTKTANTAGFAADIQDPHAGVHLLPGPGWGPLTQGGDPWPFSLLQHSMLTISSVPAAAGANQPKHHRPSVLAWALGDLLSAELVFFILFFYFSGVFTLCLFHS